MVSAPGRLGLAGGAAESALLISVTEENTSGHRRAATSSPLNLCVNRCVEVQSRRLSITTKDRWRRCSPPDPPPTTALTCVLRCFPCEPTWAGSPFLHRPPTPPMVRMTRSKTFQAYLPSCHRTYSCIHCRAHLANHDELISKSFQGSQGRAYLFNSVVNVGCGPAEERVLLTGLHAVADIYCENCKTTLGWKYEHAFESSQKYKEGKFIIELAHMIKDNGWD
ncbi:protein yippee-like 2 isoform X1 [Synchiropus splendidus]|uniref:protein yippee-like 2 isoform X1 n=1 Tax=Synchiropus splendidus TaxID=270530 RepID=UPI00237DF9D3|nr:protein yippee-like 2 isoform X1 [Synchiropus splendidus]